MYESVIYRKPSHDKAIFCTFCMQWESGRKLKKTCWNRIGKLLRFHICFIHRVSIKNVPTYLLKWALYATLSVYSGTWPPIFSEISSHLTDIEQRIVSMFLRHGVPMLVPTSRVSDKSHYIENCTQSIYTCISRCSDALKRQKPNCL